MSVKIEDVLNYLRVKKADAELNKKIEELMSKMNQLRPQKVIGEFDITICENGVMLEGTDILLTGNLVKSRLRECFKIVILAATLGVLGEISCYQDSYSAVILDAIYTAYLEDYINGIEKELFVEYKKAGFFLKGRFSAGYSDFPLSAQKSIYETLNLKKHLGVSLNDEFMFYPNKTVTAIMGIKKI